MSQVGKYESWKNVLTTALLHPHRIARALVGAGWHRFDESRERASHLALEKRPRTTWDETYRVWRPSSRSVCSATISVMKSTIKTFNVEAIDIVRMKDGRIVEHWGVIDTAGMAEQLGLAP